MSDNPFQRSPEGERRIAQRAHQLWEEDGRPEGREGDFRERAEFLIGLEDHKDAALEPNPLQHPDPLPGVNVEEALVQENYGEFPERMTDQGERRHSPMTKQELRDYGEGKTQPTRVDTP